MIKKRFLWMESVCGNWAWNTGLKKWVKEESDIESTIFLDCNSLKAFRRRLKNTPKGIEFRLVSRFIGFDITGINK
jgi:hypothetical protein